MNLFEQEQAATKILEDMPQEQADVIRSYIFSLTDKISDLEWDVDRLEGDNEDLQNEVDSLQDELDEEKQEANEALINSIREIAEERYKYPLCNQKYITVDTILDRLDYILKYGV